MGLIRLLIVAAAAFGAGVLFERGNARDACEAAGGVWQRHSTGAGFCTGNENG